MSRFRDLRQPLPTSAEWRSAHMKECPKRDEGMQIKMADGKTLRLHAGFADHSVGTVGQDGGQRTVRCRACGAGSRVRYLDK